VAPLALFCPERKRDRKGEPQDEREERYGKTIKDAVNCEPENQQPLFPCLYDYIPVYHTELVCDRQIKFENRRSIRSADDVAKIFKDELLKADREHLFSLMLNSKNVVIGINLISIGRFGVAFFISECCRSFGAGLSPTGLP